MDRCLVNKNSDEAPHGEADRGDNQARLRRDPVAVIFLNIYPDKEGKGETW